MFVLTGATGQLGSQIVEHLLERVPASTVGVSVRDPAKATSLAERGVRVRAGDFTDPAGLRHAFEGASQVLVVSAAIRGPGAADANRAAVDAALAVGAERILYTSHQAASADSLFAPQPTHAATEAHLAALGVPFVALRHGYYADSLRFFLGDAVATGLLVAPEDGPVSWTAHADLAAVDALALDEPGVLDGVTPPLTGAESLDLAAVAAELSEVLGRPVRRVVVSDEQWRESAVERGTPPAVADFMLGMYRAARRGEFDVTDPTLGTLLGRAPTPVRVTLERIAAA